MTTEAETASPDVESVAAGAEAEAAATAVAETENTETVETQPEGDAPNGKAKEPAEKPDGAPKEPAKGDKPPKEETVDTIATSKKSAEPSSSWGEDWREKMADGDEKTQKFLKGIDSPSRLAKTALELRQKVAQQGEALKRVLPDDATEEQVAEFRKANKIPDTPDGYKKEIQFPDGFDETAYEATLGEYFELAHSKNRSPADVKADMDWYFDMEARQAQAFREASAIQQKEARNTLIEEWGGPRNFDANISAMVRFGGETIGEENYQRLAGAILVNENGEPMGRLGDLPDFNRMMIGGARQRFGEDLVMIGNDTSEDAFASRAAAIKKEYIETGGRVGKNGWTAEKEKEFSFIANEEARRAKRG